jgi:hypothetical protein
MAPGRGRDSVRSCNFFCGDDEVGRMAVGPAYITPGDGGVFEEFVGESHLRGLCLVREWHGAG